MECWVTWWGVGLHGVVGLHDWYCLVAPWGVLAYMVGSVGLHGWGIELYGGECWVTSWGVGLHGGECWVILVRCWITWWGVGLHGGVLGYMVESVRLHGGECSITWGC